MTGLHPLKGKTFLITGADGMLGRAFQDVLAASVPDCRVLALNHKALDVTQRESVLALQAERPRFIVHCAADVNADRCEDQPALAESVHVGGTLSVAELARRCGAKVLYPQSFLIFGESAAAITEQTTPSPLSVYGRCKLEAEVRLRERLSDALVVRMGGFFGGDAADKNFVGKFTGLLARMVKEGKSSIEVGDRVWQPSYTIDLAANSLLLLARDAVGIYNMAAHGEATFCDVARACVERMGLKERISVQSVSASAMSAREKAPRPLRAVMKNARLAAEGLDRQRPWSEGLGEYLARPYFRGLLQ